MKFLRALAAAALAFALAAPSFADDYPVVDGGGTTQTFGSKLLSGVQYPDHVCGGVYSSSWVTCNFDSSGNQGVNVENSPTVTIGAGSNTIGSISNTAFGATQSGSWSVGLTGSLPGFASTPAFTISGTLPAFAATPTVNAAESGSWTVTANAGTGPFPIAGTAAAGSSLSGNPVQNGCQAVTSEPTNQSNGQMTPLECGTSGKTITLPYSNKENAVQGSASATGTGATTIIAAAGSGLKNYITGVQCGRTDAGTTAIYVTFDDSASTIFVIPNNGGGGGHDFSFSVPLATAANTAFTFTASASTSTVYCSAQGYKGA